MRQWGGPVRNPPTPRGGTWTPPPPPQEGGTRTPSPLPGRGGGGVWVPPRGYPDPPQGGYPVRYPPWPGQKEYSLHGGRYASCVHAGGLSCFVIGLTLWRLLMKADKATQETTKMECIQLLLHLSNIYFQASCKLDGLTPHPSSKNFSWVTWISDLNGRIYSLSLSPNENFWWRTCNFKFEPQLILWGHIELLFRVRRLFLSTEMSLTLLFVPFQEAKRQWHQGDTEHRSIQESG